jgi:endogenous inhibitor of DNA gyrase (YacG/DUF329 family)
MKNCEQCLEKYKPNKDLSIKDREKSRFCSRPCYWAWMKNNIKPPSRKRKEPWNRGRGVTKECGKCGKKFYVSIYRELTVKFCSRECARKGKIEKACLECKKTYSCFPYIEKTSKFCSRKCQNIYLGKAIHSREKSHFWKGGALNTKTITVMCLACSSEFGVVPSRQNTAKYCSKSCYVKSKTGSGKFIVSICKKCGNSIKNRKERTYCSSKCRAVDLGKKRVGVPMSLEARRNMSNAQMGKPKLSCRGKNHHNWRGGKSKNRHKGQEYKQWRIAVFKRDNYTCQECGKKNIFINAHHIQDWVNYPELRFNINNGQTLCISCHAKIDFKYKNLILGQVRKELVFQ